MGVYFVGKPIATAPSSPASSSCYSTIHGTDDVFQNYLLTTSLPSSPLHAAAASSFAFTPTTNVDFAADDDVDADEDHHEFFQFSTSTLTSSSTTTNNSSGDDYAHHDEFLQLGPPLKPPPRMQLSPLLSMPAPRRKAEAMRRAVVGLSFTSKIAADFDPFLAAEERIRRGDEEEEEEMHKPSWSRKISSRFQGRHGGHGRGRAGGVLNEKDCCERSTSCDPKTRREMISRRVGVFWSRLRNKNLLAFLGFKR